MSIHPNDNSTPITKSRPTRRASEMATASTLLAVAVLLGLGITAFSSRPGGSIIQATTTGQGSR